MLKILINDQQADLEGVKFNLQLNSPIPFVPEDGLVEGSFAFGVIFPATPANKKIFGFPHRLEIHPDVERDFQGNLYFNGRMLFEIIVTLTEASDYSFKANIKVDLGYYTNLIGDKTLRDLEYDGTVSIGTTMTQVVAHAQAVVAQVYPAVNYNFPQLYNPLFYGEEKKMNLSYQNLVNNYIHGSGFHENSIDNDNVIHNYYNLCPFPYLFKVLLHCFREFGYKATGPVLDDAELATLLIYNNYALDLLEDRFKSLADLSDNQIIPEFGAQINFDDVTINIDDCYDAVLCKYLIKQSGDHQITAHLSVKGDNNLGIPGLNIEYTVFLVKDVPEVAASGFLLADDDYEAEIDINGIDLFPAADIGKYVYLYIELEINDLGTLKPTTGTVNADSWLLIQNKTWSNFNQYAKSINLANHVPDIKISAFLVALQKAFGIIYHFNHSTRDVEIMFLKDILASTQEDAYDELTLKSSKLAGFRDTRSYRLNFAWSSADEYTKDNFLPYDADRITGSYATLADLPVVAGEGDMAIVLNLNAVYRFETDTWNWFTDLFYEYEVGDGVNAITIDCSPLMMYGNNDNPASPEVCPKINQEGSSVHLGMKDFGFHLMFYRGLYADSEGHTYPFASNNKYGPLGNAIAGYEMILSGTNGLYAQFLEAYYNFVVNRSRPVEYDRFFSASEIRDISFIRKKRIFENSFLLDELNIPISNDSIGIATMKLLKV